MWVLGYSCLLMTLCGMGMTSVDGFFTPPFSPSTYCCRAVPSQLNMNRARTRGEPGQNGPSPEVIDQVIGALRASTVKELGDVVVKNVKVVANPSFFLRLAQLRDEEKVAKERLKLETLGDRVVEVLQAVTKEVESRLDTSSELVQIVLSSCAEKDGEFLLPLSAERLAGLRQSMQLHWDDVDDNFLSTVQAWMKKSNEDGLEGMVVILQKVLQVYAGERILKNKSDLDTETSPSSLEVFNEILQCDPDQWTAVVTEAIASGRASGAELATRAQLAITSVVLDDASGSLGQQIMAEYMRELLTVLQAVEG
ncbi:unnamed protein product [Chrysoparadoxa australica]